MKTIEPVKNPQKMISYWTKEKLSLTIIIISGTFYNMSMVLGPIWQGKLLDSLVNLETFNTVLQIALMFVGIIIFVMVIRYIKRFYVRRFANNTNATMRLMIYNNIIYKSERELNNEESGVLMSKIIADVDGCVEGMRKFTTEVFDTGVLLVTYIITLLGYDWKLTIISAAFTIIAMFIADKLKVIIVKAVSNYRNNQSKLSKITFDYIDNAMLYRVFGRENANEERYNKELNEYTKSAIISNYWETAMQPIYNVISMIGVIFVIVYGANNIYNNIWTVGIFSTYISIFTAMSIRASKAAKLLNSVQKAKVSWDRINPYLENYQELEKSKMDISSNTTIDIKDVSFKYPKSDYLFKNIDIELKSGDIIGVTGQVASGKSSFGKLFLKEYPYDGNIMIDGTNMNEINEMDMSKLVSYLGHNPNLISDTIEENIKLGKDGNLDKIIDTVCFREDLSSMPDGLKTIVGFKGIKLSGGQQARVALARTLYANSKIVILDDPFSAVDATTEEEIINNLKNNYKDTIFIIISHRLKMFKNLNKVLLLEGNNKYSYDAHDNLMKYSLLYQNLVNLQETGDTNEQC